MSEREIDRLPHAFERALPAAQGQSDDLALDTVAFSVDAPWHSAGTLCVVRVRGVA
jgi:hypothetical protein